MDSVSEMMAVIRKNTQHSSCIDTYEKLLKEIENEEVVRTAVSDMNRFIEECMLLFKEIDKMDNNRFKSKMLTDDFICPERFFKTSLKMTNQYLYLNAALNYRFTDNDYNNVVKYSISNKNRLGDVWKKQYFDKKSEESVYSSNEVERQDEYFKKNDIFVNKILSKFNVTEDSPEIREECRKAILLWNYHPAIVKAIIQTKRRTLNLDKNPQMKRFI